MNIWGRIGENTAAPPAVVLRRRRSMMSTAEPIIAHLRQEFEELLSYVTGPSTRASTA